MRFEDWTKKVPRNKHQRSLAAAFGDVDGDGHVDLYVTNYEDWKDNTYPYPDLLFRNRGGDKGFEPWWEAKGDQVMPARGVTFLDVDGDGRPEIYVSNYCLAPNFLWFYDPKTVLKDRAVSSGLAWGQNRGVARARARQVDRGPGRCARVAAGPLALRKAPRSPVGAGLRDLTGRDRTSLGSSFISSSAPLRTRARPCLSNAAVFAQGLRTRFSAAAPARPLLQHGLCGGSPALASRQSQPAVSGHRPWPCTAACAASTLSATAAGAGPARSAS